MSRPPCPSRPSPPRWPGCCRRRRIRQNGEVYYKYEARVKLDNKRLPLKEYDTWDEAALVHDVAKFCLRIEHGHFNSPLERYIDLPRIPSELPLDEIVEFILKCAKAIQQQETYQKARSMPPSNLFDPLNPSLMIEDSEVFMESQDVQACDPTNNYLCNPSNQSLNTEDDEEWVELLKNPLEEASNCVEPALTGFESCAMGVSERTLYDHVEAQPNSIRGQSTGSGRGD